jgi:hypothetical protein
MAKPKSISPPTPASAARHAGASMPCRRAWTPPPFAPMINTAAAALGITLRPWEAALEEFLRS